METPIPILSFWHIYLICGSLAEKAYSLAREFSRDQNIKQKSDFVKIYIYLIFPIKYTVRNVCLTVDFLSWNSFRGEVKESHGERRSVFARSNAAFFLEYFRGFD